jgi:hypothetical protein
MLGPAGQNGPPSGFPRNPAIETLQLQDELAHRRGYLPPKPDVVVGQSFGKNAKGSRMKVKRIVANVNTPTPATAERFYRDVLGLELLMDMGWIMTYGSHDEAMVQISIMSEGGSSASVPDLSIEVDDLEAALDRVKPAAFRSST